MGRGLSELQKCILRLALKNVEVEGRHTGHGTDVLHSEILAEFFGWRGNTRDQEGKRIYSQSIFEREEIGAKQYASVQAALSRAITRLEQRGLVTATHGVARWAGANLTDAGMQLAKELSVNKSANLPLC